MNKEEKNAIKFLQKLEFDEYEWWYFGEEYETREETEKAFEKAQKIIINLIDKQQEEIERLKNAEEYAKLGKETLLDTIHKQQKEIEALKLVHETYKEEIESIEDRYINKDKIREKIRNFKAVKQEIFRLENKLGIPSITYDIVRNDYCEKMLEDLLKEGDKNVK